VLPPLQRLSASLSFLLGSVASGTAATELVAAVTAAAGSALADSREVEGT